MRHTNSRHHLPPLARAHQALLLAIVIAGCAKKGATDPAPTAASLVVVQGANQSAQGGKELPTAIIMRVLDANGLPMEAVPVSFVISAGGGSVTPGSLLSDANGEAKTKWTVGPDDPVQRLDAAVPGLAPVSISATALLPYAIVVAQGNNQTGKVGVQLPTSIVIRVVGPTNTPMVGVSVAFQIASGGGVITPQSAITSALGEVTAKWTLGTIAGSNSLTVVVGNLQPQLLVATATP